MDITIKNAKNGYIITDGSGEIAVATTVEQVAAAVKDILTNVPVLTTSKNLVQTEYSVEIPHVVPLVTAAPRNNKAWSHEEISFLRENYSSMKTKALSKALRRKPTGIRAKANELGIHKH